MTWRVAVLLSLVLGAGAVPVGVDDPEDGGKHWVVIVAGSNGWYNYRHQVRNPCVLVTGFVPTKWPCHFGRQFCFSLKWDFLTFPQWRPLEPGINPFLGLHCITCLPVTTQKSKCI